MFSADKSKMERSHPPILLVPLLSWRTLPVAFCLHPKETPRWYNAPQRSEQVMDAAVPPIASISRLQKN